MCWRKKTTTASPSLLHSGTGRRRDSPHLPNGPEGASHKWGCPLFRRRPSRRGRRGRSQEPDLTAVRPPWGGRLARLLYPVVLAEARQSGSSAAEVEAWGWVPPALVHEGAIVQPDWLFRYLLTRRVIRPAAVLRMPRFNLSPAEARTLTDYFAAAAGVEFPYTPKPLPHPSRSHAARLGQRHEAAAGPHDILREVSSDRRPIGPPAETERCWPRSSTTWAGGCGPSTSAAGWPTRNRCCPTRPCRPISADRRAVGPRPFSRQQPRATRRRHRIAATI